MATGSYLTHSFLSSILVEFRSIQTELTRPKVLCSLGKRCTKSKLKTVIYFFADDIIIFGGANKHSSNALNSLIIGVKHSPMLFAMRKINSIN